MILGLDYYNTISVAPKIYRKLTADIIKAGGEVHIVTAVHEKNRAKVLRDIKRSQVPHTAVHIVPFIAHDEVPKLKLAKCKELHIQMFVDDRIDICTLMFNNQILPLLSLGEPT